MRARSTPRVSKKDLQILNFIWWWKVTSTAAITARFAPDYQWSPYTVHWRLTRLRKKGYIGFAHLDEAHAILWTLTAAGFRIIEGGLRPLKERGFASENVHHDHLVQAVHLGEWLPRHSAIDVTLFTEQELRRVDPECYPEWVPVSSLHRPDGYWNLPSANGRQVVALEVEVSLKRKEDYGKLGNFYNHEQRIDSVLWIIHSHSIARHVIHGAQDSALKFRFVHDFVKLEDFLEKGWNAKIYLGPHADQNISEFLNKYRSQQDHSKAPATPQHAGISAILDTRLYRVKSRTSEKKGAPVSE